MKPVAVFLSILLLAVAPTTGRAVLVSGKDGLPFIERIPVPDFLSVESRLDQSLSKSSNLVFYCLTAGGDWSAVALRKGPAEDYDLILLVGTEDPAKSGQPKRSSTVIPAAIAQQIEKALQFMLTRGVFPPSGQTGDIARFAGDWWIFLRVNETRGIAGIAQHAALHRNRNPAAEAYQDIWSSLRLLAEAPPENRDAIITDLDRLSAKFVLTEEARTKH